MRGKKIRCLQKSGQNGTAALEFAWTFPVLFGLFYAVITYTFPLLMMQAFHSAAADGARAAVRETVDAEDVGGECPQEDYGQRVECKAREAASDRIDWLQPLSDDQITVSAEFVNGVLDVTVEYPAYNSNPPIPVLGKLPYFNREFPPLPETLLGEASIRL